METELKKKRIAEILQNALNKGDYKNKTELSEKLNTTITSLTKYLNGTTFPQSDWLFYLCKELKIAPNWIIFGDEEEKKLPEEDSKEKILSQFVEMQKNLLHHKDEILNYKEDEIKRLKQEIEFLKKSITTSNNNENIVKQPVKQLTKEEKK